MEESFKHSTNNTSALSYYHLNSFSDLLTSGVTLFELTVVNNWFIVMDAYASVAHPASRLYFMLFYLFTMVVLTIVVASVLEAFRFRIQYKQQTSKRDGKTLKESPQLHLITNFLFTEEQMLHEEVVVDWNSLQEQIQDPKLLQNLQTDFIPGVSLKINNWLPWVWQQFIYFCK